MVVSYISGIIIKLNLINQSLFKHCFYLYYDTKNTVQIVRSRLINSGVNICAIIVSNISNTSKSTSSAFINSRRSEES